MPMRSEMIHQIYIADGFDDDCDMLIHRCTQIERLNYEVFCDIWKEMQFDSLFTGRASMVEIAELSEEMVHIAKQYMLVESNNFEESVAGLFLVYGLLNLQPYAGFAILRLVPEDVPKIKRVEEIARRHRRHDVLYILGTVLVKHTQYHAEQRERGIEQVYRKYLEDFISIDRSGYRPRGVFYRQTEELDVIRELAAVTDRYENAKKAVMREGKPDPSLCYINKSLPTELDSSLKRIINGITAEEDDDISAADVHYSRVQAIKEKAMKNAVVGVRHLTSAAQRTYESPNKIVSEIKSKPGKIKTSSPTKTYLSPKRRDICNLKSRKENTTDSNAQSPKKKSPKKKNPKDITQIEAGPSTSKPVKRNLPSKRRIKPKKSKIHISSSSDSDSDIDISELAKDSESDYDISHDISSDEELALSALVHPKKSNAKRNYTNLSSRNELDVRAVRKPKRKCYKITSEDEMDFNLFTQPNSSKDVEVIQIDDIIPHVSTDDIEVDPDTIDKLNKLKAKIAFLEGDMDDSASSINSEYGEKSNEKQNANEESNKKAIDDFEVSDGSDNAEENSKAMIRHKKIRNTYFFRRLSKLGVIPTPEFPDKKRTTKQIVQLEDDTLNNIEGDTSGTSDLPVL